MHMTFKEMKVFYGGCELADADTIGKLGIDDDDMVTAIDVRSVVGLMFSHQDHSDVTRQSTENLVRSIDDVPLLFDLAWLGHGCWLSHHGIDLWIEWVEIENR